MAFVRSQGIRIYYELLGEGVPLLMHSGTLGGIDAWRRDGYIDDLKDDYQLILLDHRGHGKSDKPYDTNEYTGPKFARDVVAVIDDLGLEKVIFWGYSLGGRIGYELAGIAPERVSAFILGGASPYAEASHVEAEGDASDPEVAKATVLAYFGMTPQTIPEPFKESILSNDFRAVLAGMRDKPSIEHVLTKMTMPCLIYAGEEDARLEPSRRAAAALPNAQLVTLPNMTHIAALVAKDAVVPKVRQFLKTLS